MSPRPPNLTVLTTFFHAKISDIVDANLPYIHEPASSTVEKSFRKYDAALRKLLRQIREYSELAFH